MEIIGLNSRLDSLHAEILSFRLRKLKSIIDKRRKNINFYKKYLKTNKVKIINNNKKQIDTNVMFVTYCEDRDNLQNYLKKNKIQSLIYYKTPLHLHKATSYLGYKKGSFPIAEKLAKKVLSFPHHQYLKESQIKFICKKINSFYS